MFNKLWLEKNDRLFVGMLTIFEIAAFFNENFSIISSKNKVGYEKTPVKGGLH